MPKTKEMSCEVVNGVGVAIFSRPDKLNAFSLDMVRFLDATLAEWEQDPEVKMVLLTAEGNTFSSGADIKKLYGELEQGELAPAREFFREAYMLYRRIYNSKKPFVTLAGGPVLGDAAALAVYGSHRVFTDHVRFSLPETGIGFFPGGTSYFLSRCPGMIGRYLALSGAKINAADCLYAGIATHHVPHVKLEALKENILAGGFSENAFQEVTNVIETHVEQPEVAPLESYHAAIDICFAKESIEEIMSALATKDGEWEAKTLQEMNLKSPSSLKVSLKLIRAGTRLAFEDALQLEYRVTQHFLGSHDFREGIRAAIIDRDLAPKWKPDFLESVSQADVDAFFAPQAADELKFEKLADAS